MNGELYQISTIVMAARKAMQTGKQIEFALSKYENSIRFITKNYTAPNVSEWFEQLKKDGLEDIKLLCPYAVKDRNLLAFSNMTASSIVCFFENGRVTYFMADWEFDSKHKEWNILYSEHEWENPPSEKPRFENNTDSFRKVLLDIQKLAVQIECENFAKVFGSAIQLLDDGKIFEAAGQADVFGGMCSWNDSPPYMAHEKGLDREYDTLSDELLKNLRFAILYAVNEFSC